MLSKLLRAAKAVMENRVVKSAVASIIADVVTKKLTKKRDA